MQNTTLIKAVKAMADMALSEKGQRFICGTYSDGNPRSLTDAVRDEFISPNDRADWEKKKKKKHKKKKKKDSNVDIFRF